MFVIIKKLFGTAFTLDVKNDVYFKDSSLVPFFVQVIILL